MEIRCIYIETFLISKQEKNEKYLCIINNNHRRIIDMNKHFLVHSISLQIYKNDHKFSDLSSILFHKSVLSFAISVQRKNKKQKIIKKSAGALI